MAVYLLHFATPICPTRPTQHYLGWTNDLDQRIRKHRKGKGARLTEVAFERGIGFQVAEVLEGDRTLEQRLKKIRHHNQMCPICNPARGHHA